MALLSLNLALKSVHWSLIFNAFGPKNGAFEPLVDPIELQVGPFEPFGPFEPKDGPFEPQAGFVSLSA